MAKQQIEVRIAAHPLQVKIAQLVADKGIDQMTLREIGAVVGTASAQQVQHHLNQLVRYGFLDIVSGKYRLGKALNGLARYRR